MNHRVRSVSSLLSFNYLFKLKGDTGELASPGVHSGSARPSKGRKICIFGSQELQNLHLEPTDLNLP